MSHNEGGAAGGRIEAARCGIEAARCVLMSLLPGMWFQGSGLSLAGPRLSFGCAGVWRILERAMGQLGVEKAVGQSGGDGRGGMGEWWVVVVGGCDRWVVHGCGGVLRILACFKHMKRRIKR